MFSGIVEETGTIFAVVDSKDGRKFCIQAPLVTDDAKIGDSISVNGCCLTATEIENDTFCVELVHETLRKTTLGSLEKGSKVNLERSLRLSDRLGGHLVSGHVETVAIVSDIQPEGFSKVLTFSLPAVFAPFFVEKGSVAVEGVSLTVWGLVDLAKENETATSEERTRSASQTGSEAARTDGQFSFKVAVIPHTLEATTLGTLRIGDQVNIETDIVARYVARWLEPNLLSQEKARFSFPSFAL